MSMCLCVRVCECACERACESVVVCAYVCMFYFIIFTCTVLAYNKTNVTRR